MPRFSNKTVIVTGAGSGIGAAATRRFADEGANVVAFDTECDGIADALDDVGDRLLVQAGDATAASEVQATVDAAIDRFGGIDVLILNAGIADFATLPDTDEATWKRIIDVNVNGPYHFSKAAMPALVKSRGSIVMTSSVSGLGGDWGMTAYNASKGAVSNLVRSMAIDCGKDGVRVNAVNPCVVRTPLTEELLADDAIRGALEQRVPLGRAGEPEDVAAVMAFLASDDARFVTGVNLPVDGGCGASNGQPPLS